jgi:formate C-acetyltransferase
LRADFSQLGEVICMEKELGVKDRVARIKPRYPLSGEKFTVKGPVAPQLRGVNLQSADKRGCSPRIERLRQSYFQNVPTVCTCRARTYTEVYKETEGEPTVIRRGKAFKQYCEEKPIVIQDDELIVGSPGCRPRYVTLVPDYAWQWILDELDTFATRAQDPYLISEEQKRELREEIIPYWKGKSLYEYWLGHVPAETKKLMYRTNLGGAEFKLIRGMGHAAPGYGNVVFPKGFKGIEETARQTLSKLSYENPLDHEKIHFLEAVILCCQGMKILGERHAQEAQRLAAIEKERERKQELSEIAEICDWVPYNPPRTFHEAAQTCWFVQLGTKMTQASTSHGLGRFDQYMYPYYERDIKEGRLTKEKAQEIIECLWVKNAEIIPVTTMYQSRHFAGYVSSQNANAGGLTREGADATNELSYMCLQATADVRLNSPSLTVRVHKNTSDNFLIKAAEVIRLGGGMPQVHNDDVGIKMMLACGTTIEDAYDYDVRGCSEAQVQGKMWKYSDAGALNMGAALEWALNDGYSRVLPGKERWGLPTHDPRKFKTYEELEEAFKQQLAYLTRHECIANMIIEEAHAVVCPEPYVSSLFEGPVERGVDYLRGGCLYNVGPAPQFTGLADVSNSLAAIKKFVFDEKTLTMDELINALNSNFAGREDLRLRLFNRGPKYGRDDDYADEIVRKVADFCAEEPRKYISMRGCKFISGMYPVSANTPLGMAVGALPSGRKAGMPLADGISPQQGTDRSPTEVVKSVTKFDMSRHLDGGMLNMKFNPSVLAGENGLKNFVSLIRSFLDRGGWHIQFNVIDATTLRDAQQHPGKYPTLMVRVAGYSAYFNDLCRETQDDIISRVEHTSC